MKWRALGWGWGLALSLAATMGPGCSSSGSTPPLFQDHFESYALDSALMGAGTTWSDPIYGEGPAWTVVKDPDHPERHQVARLEGEWSGAIAGDAAWGDYCISARVRPTGDYAGIVGRYQDGSDFYVLVLRSAESKVQLTKSIGTVPLEEADLTVDLDAYTQLAMELRGDVIDCFVDGVLEFSHPGATVTQGQAGLVGSGGFFDDVVVSGL